ncbi:MAG: hypothetical protein MHPSP_002539, partial [Paramarteilia canceri]
AKKINEKYAKNVHINDVTQFKKFVDSDLNRLKEDQSMIELMLTSSVELLENFSSPINHKFHELEHSIYMKIDFKESYDSVLELCNIKDASNVVVLRFICLLANMYPERMTKAEYEALV